MQVQGPGSTPAGSAAVFALQIFTQETSRAKRLATETHRNNVQQQATESSLNGNGGAGLIQTKYWGKTAWETRFDSA